MSAATLWRIEHGQRALTSRSEVVALAKVLRVPPSDLTRLPVPAPANGDVDSAVEEVRLALMAVSRHRPGGQVASVEELCARFRAVESVDFPRRGVALPGLIRDLHTTLAAGRDLAELLDLAVLIHTQTTRGWLYIVGAPLDLCWQAATLAQQAAERREDPTALGVATWGSVIEMLRAGAFGLAREELDAVSVPTKYPAVHAGHGNRSAAVRTSKRRRIPPSITTFKAGFSP